jgi:hypothetical protein
MKSFIEYVKKAQTLKYVLYWSQQDKRYYVFPHGRNCLVTRLATKIKDFAV